MPIDPSTQYLYLTTTGRSSGEPREIEIWFGLIGSTVYLLSGSGVDNGRPKAHWVRNILQKPEVTVRIDDVTYRGIARIVAPAPSKIPMLARSSWPSIGAARTAT